MSKIPFETFEDLKESTNKKENPTQDTKKNKNIEVRDKKISHSFYIFEGIDTDPHEPAKKKYTQEDIDKAYEEGYNACQVQMKG